MKKHIPNILTCSNLVSGCIAIYFALYNRADIAFAFIMLGAWFDFFDGLTARALGVSGKLGIELDSLADCVTFGVAPSSMIFVLFNKVAYPAFMGTPFFFFVMPFTAFLMAAFSAMRLAKFNLDERQHTSFIGMPTPANAIFWASLICSCESFLTSPRFNALFLFLFMILSCWLLVCEIPMFAFKFKNKSWKDNKIKYIFIICFWSIMGTCATIGAIEGNLWQKVCLAFSLSIGLYVAMCLVALYLPKKD